MSGKFKNVIVILACIAGLLFIESCQKSSEPTIITPRKITSWSSQGLAFPWIDNLLTGCSGARVSAVGYVISPDIKHTWDVPADTEFTTGTKASDLYNECSGVTLSNLGQLDLSKVPLVVVDADGTVITAYIFADNYFELYINGMLIGVDPVPYTPFNSSVLQFKVKKPYTIAVMLVDWEEHLGVGSEVNGINSFHPGDGGFIAYFSDGTKSDASWKAQTFYIAPLADISLVTENDDGTRSSAKASVQPSCDGNCYALHWTVPADWKERAFDDTGWPAATLYSNSTVGVNDKPAFTNFSSIWASASFIWSSNLILDNMVLVRKNVQ